jgi:hypothetical protein
MCVCPAFVVRSDVLVPPAMALPTESKLSESKPPTTASLSQT